MRLLNSTAKLMLLLASSLAVASANREWKFNSRENFTIFPFPYQFNPDFAVYFSTPTTSHSLAPISLCKSSKEAFSIRFWRPRTLLSSHNPSQPLTIFWSFSTVAAMFNSSAIKKNAARLLRRRALHQFHVQRASNRNSVERKYPHLDPLSRQQEKLLHHRLWPQRGQ